MIPPQGVDKAQSPRPLDKAFPAGPELPERGLPEQQVNLEGGCARQDGLELKGMGIPNQTAREISGVGLSMREMGSGQRGVSPQKVLEHGSVY